MRKVFLSLVVLGCSIPAFSQQPLRVMMIFAHPDEGEVYTGGTAALYTRLGHQVKFMSLTNGDKGHWEMKPAELAARRYQEAMTAKKILNLAEYEVLEYHDQGLVNTKESREKVIKSIQAFKPDVVFTYYPAQGGHIDNMTAGYIVRDAARDLKMENLPVFFYVRDYHTSTFSYIPDFAFSIDSVWNIKLEACGAHQTQVAESIPHSMGILDEVKRNPAKQKEVINDNTYEFSKVFPTYAYALEKWYGKDAASKIQYAEAFEIAEFGRQITDDEVFTLLPMLEQSYVIAGTKDWTDTGFEIKKDEVFEFTAEGKIVWKREERQTCGPDGDLYLYWGNKPVPGAPTGALIARIGDSKDFFLIGSGKKIIVNKSGRLYLGINDDNTGDNDGEFRVWIKKINRN